MDDVESLSESLSLKKVQARKKTTSVSQQLRNTKKRMRRYLKPTDVERDTDDVVTKHTHTLLAMAQASDLS